MDIWISLRFQSNPSSCAPEPISSRVLEIGITIAACVVCRSRLRRCICIIMNHIACNTDNAASAATGHDLPQDPRRDEARRGGAGADVSPARIFAPLRVSRSFLGLRRVGKQPLWRQARRSAREKRREAAHRLTHIPSVSQIRGACPCPCPCARRAQQLQRIDARQVYGYRMGANIVVNAWKVGIACSSVQCTVRDMSERALARPDSGRR